MAGQSAPQANKAIVFFHAIWNRITIRRNSLVGRLIRLASAWFIFALVITGLGLTAYFHQAALHRFQVGVGLTAYDLYVDTNVNNDGSISTPDSYDPRTERTYSGSYWQVSEISPQGVMINRASTSSRSLWNARLGLPRIMLAQAQAHPGQTFFYNSTGPRGEPLRVAVIYSMIQGRDFVFLAGEDRHPMDRDVETFGLWTALALVLLAIGSLIAIFFQVRFGLRPLFDLTDEIAHIQSGEQQRLLKTYPAEITPVARQINTFLDYSQEVVERQRTHVGNLAHALKTPLSVLLATAGDAPGPLNDTIRKQAEAMRAQVDHHLRRARAAARSQTVGERTLVEPVLDELAVMLEQVFHDKGVSIDWRAPDRLAFRGEKADLQEIAGNLIENACIWSKKRVRVIADFNAATQVMTLNIEDDGPGLKADRFDEVLKRGARLDESVPGSGLGLSIVDELVRAYGGHLGFETSTLGGLRVKVDLPGNLVES